MCLPRLDHTLQLSIVVPIKYRGFLISLFQKIWTPPYERDRVFTKLVPYNADVDACEALSGGQVPFLSPGAAKNDDNECLIKELVRCRNYKNGRVDFITSWTADSNWTNLRQSPF